MKQSWRALLASRKFQVMLLDTAVSITLYFGSKYLGADVFVDVKFLIGALQAPVLFVITAIAVEDRAALRAGVHPACFRTELRA